MSKFDVAMFVLRLFFGLSMSYHGLNKLTGNGLNGTASWFSSIGMKHPRTQALLASISEITAGLLFAIGLATPFAGMVFIALMIVAIWTVHWRVGFFIFLPNGGWEYCAAILVVAASVALMGPGQISIDNALGISHDLGVFSLPLGIVLAVCHLTLWYRPKNIAASS